MQRQAHCAPLQTAALNSRWTFVALHPFSGVGAPQCLEDRRALISSKSTLFSTASSQPDGTRAGSMSKCYGQPMTGLVWDGRFAPPFRSFHHSEHAPESRLRIDHRRAAAMSDVPERPFWKRRMRKQQIHASNASPLQPSAESRQLGRQDTSRGNRTVFACHSASAICRHASRLAGLIKAARQVPAPSLY